MCGKLSHLPEYGLASGIKSSNCYVQLSSHIPAHKLPIYSTSVDCNTSLFLVEFHLYIQTGNGKRLEKVA